jgi:hypothetical protein
MGEGGRLVSCALACDGGRVGRGGQVVGLGDWKFGIAPILLLLLIFRLYVGLVGGRENLGDAGEYAAPCGEVRDAI